MIQTHWHLLPCTEAAPKVWGVRGDAARVVVGQEIEVCTRRGESRKVWVREIVKREESLGTVIARVSDKPPVRIEGRWVRLPGQGVWGVSTRCDVLPGDEIFVQGRNLLLTSVARILVPMTWDGFTIVSVAWQSEDDRKAAWEATSEMREHCDQ